MNKLEKRINIPTHTLKTLIILFSIVLFTWSHFPGLHKDVINPDGINWHPRAYNFAKGLATGNLGDTYQVYHPGTTLMWVSGPVLYHVGERYMNQGHKLYAKEDFLTYDYAAKASVVIAVSILFAICIFLLKDILSPSGILIFSILNIAEPFMLGERRLFHLDALMAYSTLASFLMFFHYCFKHKKIFYLIGGSFFLAFAVLTKTTSLVFIPVPLLMIFAGQLSFKKKVFSYLLLLVFSSLFTFALFPAVWKNPVKKVPYYYKKMSEGVTLIGYEGRKEIGKSGKGESTILEKSMKKKPLEYYPRVLMYRLSPGMWVISGLTVLGSIYFFIRHFIEMAGKQDRTFEHFDLFVFTVFLITTFYVALTMATKTSERYALIFLPFMFLCTATTLGKAKLRYMTILVLIYVLSMIPQYKEIYPYFFAYGNSFLGGTQGKFNDLKSPAFGVGILGVWETIQEYRNWDPAYFTVAGTKSLKAISSGARFERAPNCTTDYFLAFARDLKPKDVCVGKTYDLIAVNKIGNMDYWYIYKSRTKTETVATPESTNEMMEYQEQQ